MELGASNPGHESRLMAASSMAFTARYAAKHLAVIEELAEDMAPEDGRLSVITSLDDDVEAINASRDTVSTTSTSYLTTGGRASWAKADLPRGLSRMDTLYRMPAFAENACAPNAQRP
ncbi:MULTISPECIES: hypothetical protein [unclassified Sphingomonas]|uniref:hypothetical protein n=1 Tax=unclassified Sphingomonas TaxID=196159 RepID=UPI0012E15682|nr:MULTISPECIES: hypothetical protein [unclassified Sphingomonas]